MRFKGFFRKFVGTPGSEFINFGPEHFKQAGIGFAPSAGMPLLEAYQLVNKFNSGQHTPQFVYFLEA